MEAVICGDCTYYHPRKEDPSVGMCDDRGVVLANNPPCTVFMKRA